MKNYILSVLFLVGIIVQAQAKEIPAPPQTYVYDEVHVLSGSATAQLSQRLMDEDKTTGNQVVVAFFKSLDGEDLNEYSNRVFHSWKIGQKGKDNGILLAVFWEDRKVYIEVGYGLEPVVTDAFSKDVILNQLTPNLKNQPDVALNQSLDRILGKIKGQDPQATTPISPKDAPVNWVAILALVVIILIFMGILQACGVPAFDILWIILNIVGSSSDSEGSGGGGFSGGGGDSGGGGASGDF